MIRCEKLKVLQLLPTEYSLEDVITLTYELMMMTKIQLKLLLNNKSRKNTFKQVIFADKCATMFLDKDFSSLETTYRNFRFMHFL
jgi:hypothetical protein